MSDKKVISLKKVGRKVFNLTDLNKARYNPRTIKDEALDGLERSMLEFGVVQDVVVNIYNDKNIVVGGHQRLKVLEGWGWKEVECNTVCLADDTREKALNVVLNSKHISGDWEPEKLSLLLEEIKLEEPDLELYSGLKLDLLEEEFRLEEPPEPPKEPEKSGRGVDSVLFTLVHPFEGSDELNIRLNELLHEFPELKIKSK